MTPCIEPGLVPDLRDLAGLDARRADIDTAGGPVHEGTNALDVGGPAPLGADVRMRHSPAPGRGLSTNLTHCCHGEDLSRRRPGPVGQHTRPEVARTSRPGYYHPGRCPPWSASASVPCATR